MTDCVRNGIIKLIMLPVSIAKNNCTTKRLYGIKYFNRFLKFNLISSSFCSENFCVGSSNNAIPIDLSSVLSEMVCAQHFRNCFFCILRVQKPDQIYKYKFHSSFSRLYILQQNDIDSNALCKED